MCKLLVSTILLQFFFNLVPASGDCIFLNDCTVALKYIEKRKDKPETTTMLQNAHCGFGVRNGEQEPKISCDQIPPFPELPPECVPFVDCPAAVKLIETRGATNPQVIRLLRNSACGDSERQDMILCGKIGNSTVTRNNLPSVDECGDQSVISKITYGTVADLDEFNWLALLKYQNPTTGQIWYGCHGTIISTKYILTAAHCLPDATNKKKLHSVVLGEHDVTTEKDCILEDCTDPIQEFSIKSILKHPNFGTNGDVSDIGLIRLNGMAKFSAFVKPICISLNSPPLRHREPLWIAGWGRTENRTMSNKKLKAQIFSLTNNDCIESINYTPDKTMLCAGSDNGTDTCKGDSGGPLMRRKVMQQANIKFFLVGIVSFGGKCGSGAAIYTDVSHFTDWIVTNMKD